MDSNIQLERLVKLKGGQWLDLVPAKRAQVPAWVAEHHPEKLPRHVEGRALHGSYNIGLTAVFTNGEEWFIRLPIVGKTRTEHLNLKIANEVAALTLIREKTDIPVPEIKARGSSQF